MVIARLSTVFLISIVQTCLLLADDFQATVGGAPPPEELSNAIASMVEKEAVSVIGPDGKIFAEFWARNTPFDGNPISGFGIRFETMPEGSFLGVVRFSESGSDFREQGIQPGLYSMRYGLHPEDGNHMGVASSRDFALLSKVNVDADPTKNLDFRTLVQLSISSSGNPHPTVLRLELPDGNSTGHIWKNEAEHRILDLEIPGDVLGIVVYGHSEE